MAAALLALNTGSAVPSSFATFTGLIWMAVLVTVGVRSIAAAVLAGISFTLLPGVFQTYLPATWGNVPTLLFGLGAVMVAANPDGVVAMNARQVQELIARLAARRRRRSGTGPPGAVPAAGLSVRGAWLRREGKPVSAVTAVAQQPRMQCQDVTVRFGGVVAVNSVSLTIPPASIVGLVGPNGAGKSTLFSVLSGLRRPNAGTVEFDGKDITGASAQHRARLGLARTFQHPEVFSGLTVREHIILAHRVSTRRSRVWSDMVTARGFRRADQEETERVGTLLDALSLTPIADQPVAALSLGMTRLVEIARGPGGQPSGTPAGRTVLGAGRTGDGPGRRDLPARR